jgi:hypothetical protein
LILPVAVREKRFLAPLLVFILGIFILSFQGFTGKAARHARFGQPPGDAGGYTGTAAQ